MITADTATAAAVNGDDDGDDDVREDDNVSSDMSFKEST